MTEINAVSQEYAKTLFDLAKEHNEVDVCEQNLQVLKQTLEENPEFMKIMLYPNFSVEQKKSILNQILKLEDGYFLYFFNVLIDNNRFEEMIAIADGFTELVRAEKGLLKATVYTKYPLSQKQSSDIKQKLTKQFAKTIELTELVDSSLVGGIKVVVKGIEYDYTIDQQLVNLKEMIMKG